MSSARLVRWCLVLWAAALPGCASHESFCGLTEVTCAESCGGAPFLQCGACPDGSVPVEDCPDGG